jgi:ABC-type transport system involved in multi-copper enzyme maturation permease subunit
VFVYEWITAARRWQAYALRSLFVLGLLVAVLVIGAGRGAVISGGTQARLRVLAEVGEKLFVAVVGTQLALVLLAAPAATAGAICLDRSRGTLTHLLATDLSDREIVLGKLAARLTPVIVLVAATLPVMELLSLLGGVDPNSLLKSFIVTMGIAALGCCVALFFSIRVRRTHEALLATYAVWGLWLLGSHMLRQIGRAIGLLWDLELPNTDPFELCFAPYWLPGSVGWLDYLVFFAEALGVSTILTAIAVKSMRRICTRDVAARAPRRPKRLTTGREAVVGWVSGLLKKTGPSLDFNPVLWREWHRNRPSRWARIAAMAFIALALTFSAIATCAGAPRDMAPWVNAFQVSIGLLFLSVIAATPLAEERARGSLDVLLTTPMETGQIVFGKWLGTYRLVPPLAVLPVFAVLGIAQRGFAIPSAIVMATFVLAAGAAITSLGLALATWCPRLGRAVGLTVSVYLLAGVGWMMAIAGILHGRDSEMMMMGSPFFWSGAVTDAVHGIDDRRLWTAAIGWTLLYAVSAVLLLGATLATFNRCLGRVSSPGYPRGGATR